MLLNQTAVADIDFGFRDESNLPWYTLLLDKKIKKDVINISLFPPKHEEEKKNS